jgi:Chromate resistance exported protein
LAIPYDMLDVEFSHHDDHCTFETLIERFGIRDRAVQRLAELIHDADLEDDKFHRIDSAVTAAVVGVVLNLAIWFGLHVIFPSPGTVDWFAVLASLVAFAGNGILCP